MMIIFSTLMMISGMLVFSMKRKHFLMMLLSLEFIVLSLYWLIFTYLMMVFSYELYFSLVYLILSVCEGALGLSILVSLIRVYGNDYFQSFSVLW